MFSSLALIRLGKTLSIAPLLETLQHGTASERRVAATIASRFPSEEVEGLLKAVLNDNDPQLRSLAAFSLLELLGLKAQSGTFDTLAGYLPARMTSPLAAVRRLAQADLAEAEQQRAMGVAPGQMTLAQKINVESGPAAEILKALRDPSVEIPTDALAHADAVSRRWSEDLLINNIVTDKRCISALSKLRTSRSVEALEELAADSSRPGAVEAELALRSLSAV